MDTNVVFAAIASSHPLREPAAAFLNSIVDRDDVAVSEFMLTELYVLLRNPSASSRPLTAAAAVAACAVFRNHPSWTVLGFPQEGRAFHDAFWARLAEPAFARRRAYDWRMAWL